MVEAFGAGVDLRLYHVGYEDFVLFSNRERVQARIAASVHDLIHLWKGA